MAGPRYQVKTPDGVLLGGFEEDEICRQIDAGALALDSLAAVDPDTHFVPITQYSVFAVAFEARFGLESPGHTSDSTPVSHSALLEALHRESGDLVSPISTTRPNLESLEDTAPATLKNTVGLLDEPTPVSLTAEPATPIAQLGLPTPPSQPTLADAPAVSEIPNTDPVLPLVIPAYPTLGDAPEGERLSPRPPPADAGPTRIAPLEAPSTPPNPGPSAGPAQLLEVSLGIGAWAVIFLVLTVAGHRLQLGPAEAALDPSSLLYWSRLVLVGGAGLILLWAFPGEPRIQRQNWAAPPIWLGVAVLVGGLAGASFPSPVPSSALPIALALSGLLALVEELFFRAFLGRVLEASFPRPLISVGLAAALYGVYASTLATVWVDRVPLSIVLRIALLAIGAGLPYALLQHWTKSLLPPLVCHLALSWAMVLSASLR